jgi:hypothetical protein
MPSAISQNGLVAAHLEAGGQPGLQLLRRGEDGVEHPSEQEGSQTEVPGTASKEVPEIKEAREAHGKLWDLRKEGTNRLDCFVTCLPTVL